MKHYDLSFSQNVIKLISQDDQQQNQDEMLMLKYFEKSSLHEVMEKQTDFQSYYQKLQKQLKYIFFQKGRFIFNHLEQNQQQNQQGKVYFVIQGKAVAIQEKKETSPFMWAGILQNFIKKLQKQNDSEAFIQQIEEYLQNNINNQNIDENNNTNNFQLQQISKQVGPMKIIKIVKEYDIFGQDLHVINGENLYKYTIISLEDFHVGVINSNIFSKILEPISKKNVFVFQQFPFPSKLLQNSQILREILNNYYEIKYQQNDLVYEEGGKNNLIFIIKSGIVEIKKLINGINYKIAFIRQGEFFGHEDSKFSYASIREFSASIKSENCQLYCLNLDELKPQHQQCFKVIKMMAHNKYSYFISKVKYFQSESLPKQNKQVNQNHLLNELESLKYNQNNTKKKHQIQANNGNLSNIRTFIKSNQNSLNSSLVKFSNNLQQQEIQYTPKNNNNSNNEKNQYSGIQNNNLMATQQNFIGKNVAFELYNGYSERIQNFEDQEYREKKVLSPLKLVIQQRDQKQYNTLSKSQSQNEILQNSQNQDALIGNHNYNNNQQQYLQKHIISGNQSPKINLTHNKVSKCFSNKLLSINDQTNQNQNIISPSQNNLNQNKKLTSTNYSSFGSILQNEQMFNTATGTNRKSRNSFFSKIKNSKRNQFAPQQITKKQKIVRFKGENEYITSEFLYSKYSQTPQKDEFSDLIVSNNLNNYDFQQNQQYYFQKPLKFPLPSPQKYLKSILSNKGTSILNLMEDCKKTLSIEKKKQKSNNVSLKSIKY